MFFLTASSIDKTSLQQRITNRCIGAVVTFEGKVRNTNERKNVVALEYEAYEPLAIKEANVIIEEAKEQFPIFDVVAAHRTGRLDVGDVAVIIVVSATHRRAAFSACQYVIDEIKKRLSIWKNEYYLDGTSAWVSCQHLHFDETDYYSRQQCIPNIAVEGQQKLKRTKALVVGAGGLGCPALTYLAAAGIGQITICDDDNVEMSNLHRQVLYSTHDIGKPKASVAKQRLQNLNPFVTVTAIKEKVDTGNVESILQGHDIVLDCTDSITAKFLLHDTCRFHNIPLVLASIYQLEGLIQVFRHHHETACLRCLWPVPPEETCIKTCANIGVVGAVPGTLGAMQAMETIKVTLNWESINSDVMVLVDLTTYAVSKVRIRKNPQCPLCSANPKITTIDLCHYQHEWEWDLNDLPRDCEWIDIRQTEERDITPPSMKHLPADDTLPFHQLDKDRRYLLVCRKGNRSRKLVNQLRQQGLTHFFSLKGGIATIETYLKQLQ